MTKEDLEKLMHGDCNYCVHQQYGDGSHHCGYCNEDDKKMCICVFNIDYRTNQCTRCNCWYCSTELKDYFKLKEK